MVSRLQVKASSIGKILQSLEQQHGKKTPASATSSSDAQQPPVKKPHYIDPIPPFNAGRMRKSPSSTLTTPATAGSTIMETSACEMALPADAEPTDADAERTRSTSDAVVAVVNNC